MRPSDDAETALRRSLQQSGNYFPVLREMDTAHALVLRWCVYFTLDDVLRIDREWLIRRRLWGSPADRWCVIRASKQLPQLIIARVLANNSESYAYRNARERKLSPEHEGPVFDEANGKPITRASLRAEVERARSVVTLPGPDAQSVRTELHLV